MNHNFFLTDIMKTGNHLLIEQFIAMNNLPNEKFDLTGEYYSLHNYNLNSYKRKFAIIDHASANKRLWANKNYWHDFSSRIKHLVKENFVFLVASPWESMKTFEQSQNYDHILNGTRHTRWLGGESWFWVMMFNKFKNKNFKFDHSYKKFDFLYLNKFPRPHRIMFFEKLQKSNILDHSLYSFLGLKDPIRLPNSYELPWVDHNFYPRYGHDQDIYEKPYNESAINIVSETLIDDENFLTEKIWKPIIAEQIFVVLGSPFYLRSLRRLGFQTFESIFDETYDVLIDNNSRIDCLVDLCKKLKRENFENLYHISREIREHNRKLFFNLNAVKAMVNNKLLELLKFFDRGQVLPAKP